MTKETIGDVTEAADLAAMGKHLEKLKKNRRYGNVRNRVLRSEEANANVLTHKFNNHYHWTVAERTLGVSKPIG
jgi:hypothetical protein